MIFGFGIEAGTLLGYSGEVSVALDPGLGVELFQVPYQVDHGGLLGLRSGVCRDQSSLTRHTPQATFVADGYGFLVVVADVGALEYYAAAGDYLAGAAHIEMVAYLLEAHLEVVAA